MENEKMPSTNINCDKIIYRKFFETIENTHFLHRDFFVIDE